MKRSKMLALLVALVLCLTACGSSEMPEPTETTQPTLSQNPTQATSPDAVTLPTAEPVTFPTAYPESSLVQMYSDAYGNSVSLPAGVDVFDYTLSFAQLPQITPQARVLEAEILRLTNLEREKQGLKPLLWEGKAYYFASVRAEEAQGNGAIPAQTVSHTTRFLPSIRSFAPVARICTPSPGFPTINISILRRESKRSRLELWRTG